jgi:hypothetical protein
VNTSVTRVSERRDPSGPLFLLLLITGAFIPSLFTEFDLNSLLASVEKAMNSLSSPVHLVLQSHGEVPALLPDSETTVAFLVSVGAGAGLSLASSSNTPPAIMPWAGTAPAREWQRSTSSSPRAPPAHS